ncbi:hypothetical protein [Bosea rubneri]|uniref:Uncharacterized protein n=1 Tax=Bosea rubneri TaxID=3075434 RepID=A0ABU3SG39_9HYPH|nr:hypothetical protein [Bosea sp. ZW T0_25]MDU0343758.1 hypothetical protein [Bosea sp. ZW T0_25]
MTDPRDHDRRLGKVETDLKQLGAGVANLGDDLCGFRREWSAKAEEDRAAHKAARLLLPQIVGMLGTTAGLTAILLGGMMFLLNSHVATVLLDLASQVAQVSLSVRGQGDAITALNTAQQQLQRDIAGDPVKLGLVEQLAGQQPASSSRPKAST